MPKPRRRATLLRDIQQAKASTSTSTTSTDGDYIGPNIINLDKAQAYGIGDKRPLHRKMAGLGARVIIETIPAWLAVGGMLGMIFGGCCSNVFALEAIVNVEPNSGTLLTFVQFIFVACTSYGSQFDSTRPPFFLKPNRVPIRRWLVNILLFFIINVLNNHAFSYNISVPIHIILRSGGSITTLVAGYIWGKRFSRLQILSVTLLTIGVVIAAWSDQQSKAKAFKTESSLPPFSTGLVILFTAQILSAIMGLYTEETYKEYGPHWKENLFYSHLLAIPLFSPFFQTISSQYLRLASSPPLGLQTSQAFSYFPLVFQKGLDKIQIPSQLAYMGMNVLTQYACIRGVNLLASAVSALTVTIVLNLRKLVSLLLSIWLFGNRLPPGTMIGAAIVFFAGGMYGLEGSKKPSVRSRHRTASIPQK
ncbi:UAA transporter family-domain-containing protein [Calycina marina]|uniref:UAA transporter family-domain-containing protein n=1 Tax=Calycina marina TaxID=1763456 RepID=A0A9P8CF94_9HELO|nr:UAA transporter family-domain-containing protein [Calycina marina]